MRHYRVSSLFNIIDLSMAIAASYVLFVQVEYEFNYNDIKDADRIYRVEFINNHDGKHTAFMSKSLARLMVTGNPVLETYHFGRIRTRPVDHSFEKFPDESLQLNGWEFTQGSIDVFGVELVEGDFAPVLKRSAMAFSRSVAERYGLQIGDRVCWGTTYKKQNSLVVGAIFEDLPENSDLSGLQAFYGPYHDNMAGENWTDWSDPLFVKLYSKEDTETFYEHVFNQINLLGNDERFGAIDSVADLKRQMRLTPFKEMYFMNDSEYTITGKVGNRMQTYTMLTIGVVMLLIAFINFFNFFVALIPQRIRSVNTQKILGAQNSQLRMGVFLETVMLVAVAVLLAWFMVELFARSSFNDLFSTPMFVADHVDIAVTVCLVSLAVALIVAVYPSWYMTSFSPAFVLKGSFGATPAGKILRNMLIGVQFVLSFVFITVTMFVYLQHRFMTDYDMGFDTNNVLTANMIFVDPSLGHSSRVGEVRSALMASSLVQDVTFGYEPIVSASGMSWGRKIDDGREDNIDFKVFPVYWNFLEVMGMGVFEGRGFDEKDMLAGNVYIFNRKAKDKLNLNLSAMVDGVDRACPIVGFCEDFYFRPLQYPLDSYAFFIFPPEQQWNGTQYVYVKLVPGCDVAAACDFVRKELAAFNPEVSEGEVNVRLLDEIIAENYDKEHNLFVLISLFSLLAIIISLLGVFGMVFFETQYRNREIAIRRVNGAQVSDILWLFASRFIRIILVCFVIAAPVAASFILSWMESFVCKMPLHWWVFALALILVTLLTMTIVVASAWRTVNRNPMNVLR